MKLNAYVAELRRTIFANLQAGREPSVGSFDAAIWKEARDRGAPQMGSVLYKPDHVIMEFLFHAPNNEAIVLAVRVESPERIVYLPVPGWVVESIWQGQVDGTFCFESEANEHVQMFVAELAADRNVTWFEPRVPTHRE